MPDGLIISHMPYGPTAYFGLHNVVMRHDIPQAAHVSEANPHIVLHNLSTKVRQQRWRGGECSAGYQCGGSRGFSVAWGWGTPGGGCCRAVGSRPVPDV